MTAEKIRAAIAFQICTRDLIDVETVLGGLLKWIREHPAEKVEKTV